MKQILWFRRDLRIIDNEILANAKGEVLPIFIFDKNILQNLPKDDKRVTFIYKSVYKLKEDLKSIGLDLAIFFDTPKNVFTKLKKENFDEILVSVDFDNYAKKRDEEIEKIIPLRRFLDSYLIDPKIILKSDQKPYKVFTPFYNYLEPLHQSNHIEEFKIATNIKKINYDYDFFPTLQDLGFTEQKLPDFLYKSADELITIFSKKIDNYQKNRDFFHLDAGSNLSVHLRFGLISAKMVFNKIKKLQAPKKEIDFFIRELIWREFYNYILFHFPKSQFENL
ncbi:deoxyribodipyrimidine photo-lyase, partial [Aliarcobacter butzleri]|nr:deoxyribodipyrimidine photo-lyase [Aliarcobacter butzleri]